METEKLTFKMIIEKMMPNGIGSQLHKELIELIELKAESQLKEKDQKFTHFEDNNGVSHGGLNDDAIKHIFDEGVLKWYVDYEDERVYLNLKN